MIRSRIGDLFENWLTQHFPDRKDKVLNRIREIRGGKLNDPRFGARMHAEGEIAEAAIAEAAVAEAEAPPPIAEEETEKPKAKGKAKGKGKK